MRIMEQSYRIPDTLTDRDGQIYTLSVDQDDDGNLWFSLELDGWEVGYLFCRFEPPQDIFITDFLIRDWSFFRRRRLKVLLRKLRRQKDLYRNFQQLGLGGKLLDVMISYAKSIGIRHIHGQITSDDAANNPKLGKFYMDHGFQIAEAKQRGNTGNFFSGHIHLYLE